MGYVNDNLMENENLLYEAKIHGFIYIPGCILFLLGFFLNGGDTLSGFVFLCALILLIHAFITKLTTELAVTSKRVIVKKGLFIRNTIELNHVKVESFNVDQSIFGRIFGFGTIFINGTGGGKTQISNIDRPLEFRKNAMQAIDASQS